MQLKVGNYPFDANSCEIAQQGEVQWNDGGQPYAIRRSVRVSGYLSGAGQAALSTAQVALEAALLTPYQDLIFYQDGGSVAAISLLNAGSITGTRLVRGPNFPSGKGVEFATIRTFDFEMEAEYPLSGTDNFLLAFHERLSFDGGEPLYAHLPAINGPPQKQLIFPQTAYTVTQEGELVGYRAYPTPPRPQWPGDLKKSPQITRKSPRRRGNGYEHYPVSYRYDFESVAPLTGVPNTWVS